MDRAGSPRRSLPPLPVPRTAPPRTLIGRWLCGGAAGSPEQKVETHPQSPWHKVLWLTGVDYFSTLGYQPGIALLAAGALSPIATGILILVTLLGAVPVYAQVAKRSFAGQGSIAMLENLLSGWKGKLVVLALLGFAATDFVITMTLSAADAAQHAVENPILHPILGEGRMWLTLSFLGILAAVFFRGFREAMGIAMGIALPYLILNLVVLIRGLMEIVAHPELVESWKGELSLQGDWVGILFVSAIIFPKLALGLSGFETGVSVMPLIQGDPDDERSATPHGRVRGTRRLLLTAAIIMSVLLLLSSFVTTLLVPAVDNAPGGKASGRALAFLAHDLLGHGFGKVYDFSTIAILWFAGASAMAGLLNLIPRYLPRFGMAPQWASHRRPLVLVLCGIAVIVTLIFRAEVEAQAGAYATGVLVLMLSAGFAVTLAFWREFRTSAAPLISRIKSLGWTGYFAIVAAVFAFTLVDNVLGRPDGVLIASIFIVAIVLLGAASRFRRATEMRVAEICLEDEDSLRLWEGLKGKKVNLVPLRDASPDDLAKKAGELRKYYSVREPMAFIHVALMDNRSEFLAPLQVRVKRVGGDYLIEVHGAIAIANTIAYVSELIDPIALFLGLTGENLMTQAFRYLFFGEGEVGLMVYKILVRYWEWTPEDDIRPLIFLMSE